MGIMTDTQVNAVVLRKVAVALRDSIFLSISLGY
ncbi:hypothetical protein OXT66_05470 [Lentilactobacillus senioris]|nr:hypothetical protein [Lentilactobacillus senioris]MCY9806999.1 hypothetical protein [Lentilactobacillus senioris]